MISKGNLLGSSRTFMDAKHAIPSQTSNVNLAVCSFHTLRKSQHHIHSPQVSTSSNSYFVPFEQPDLNFVRRGVTPIFAHIAYTST